MSILKAQSGNKLQNLFNKIVIGASVAEDPAIMYASGWKQNDNGSWEQKSSPESRRLSDNLATISTFSPTNPVTAITGKVIKAVSRWRPFIPKVGNKNIAFRQVDKSQYDDAIESGVLRPETNEHYILRGKTNPGAKHFESNVMFNRQYPFYGNPSLFNKKGYDHFIIGKMDNPKINWRKVNHKGHKNIVEPTINGEFKAPINEFEFWKRMPLGFGWRRIK